MRKMLVALSAFAVMMAVSAVAQDMGPKQPFSAEYFYTMNGQPMYGMPLIRVAATAQTMAVDFGEHGAIIELRPGSALVTMVMHSSKTYTTSSLPYDSEDLEAYFFMIAPAGGHEEACAENGVRCEKLGVEEVAGRPVEHWKIDLPGEGEGETWIDVEIGIVVKNTSAEGYGLECRNLSTEKPAASLFKIPEGYSKEGGEEW